MEAIPENTAAMSRNLPTLSIVTPSFNQGSFIEETIRSVLEQDYPSIEYIVIDGGSTDNTVEILERYSDRIAYWVSERDRGQADAINKGFERATGDLCAYLNSDDLFLPGAFRAIADSFTIENWHWCYSPVLVGESPGKSALWDCKNLRRVDFFMEQQFAQQGVFWRRDVAPRPYFRAEFRYTMDADFFTRLLLAGKTPHRVPVTTAFFRIHPGSKTSTIEPQLYAEGRKLYAGIYRQLEGSDRARLITAKRQKAIRMLSNRLDSLETFRHRPRRRLSLSLLMMRHSKSFQSLKISIFQILKSLILTLPGHGR